MLADLGPCLERKILFVLLWKCRVEFNIVYRHLNLITSSSWLNSNQSKWDNEAMAYGIITGNSDTVSNKFPFLLCVAAW